MVPARRTLLRGGQLLTCRPDGGGLDTHNWALFSRKGFERVGCGDPPPEVAALAEEVVDAGGKVVLPGLGDAHCHVYATGQQLNHLSLSGCKDMAELKGRLGRWVAAHDPAAKGEVVIGTGWDQNELGAQPTRAELDEAAGGRPVIIYRRCWHIAVANTAALERCRVTSESKVSGGSVDLDARGQPTGVLREAALDLLKPIVDIRPPDAEQRRLLQDGMRAFVSRGVTFCQTNDGNEIGGISDPWARYSELADADELPMRIFLTVSWRAIAGKPGGGRAPRAGVAHGGGLLRCERSKLWTDGALGPSTAAMLEPYSDNPNNSGLMQLTERQIAEAIASSSAAGYRIEAHIIGDRAARDVLQAMQEHRGVMVPRPVLTHCQFLSAALVRQMGALSCVASVQPQFVPSDLPIVASRVGAGTERFRYSYAWRTLSEAGVKLAGGSDSPVEEPSPLRGIYDFITHQLHPAERIDFTEALAAYTTGAAFAARAEEELGRIAPGFQADFVLTNLTVDEVLAADPVGLCRPDAVTEVWVQGRRVHIGGPTRSAPPDSYDGRGALGSVPPWLQGRCPTCGTSHHAPSEARRPAVSVGPRM
eukprot:TRINITY_DN10264_c0_g1_i1.p2 TRINITY_DN10264_c0_g1~~TRINITY_DN10264_c0_g1_i1.p2  ORF type:complete len:621 (+),score=195.09 TRINITY_DN10264_c0_g1_i1:90-1865(+)